MGMRMIRIRMMMVCVAGRHGAILLGSIERNPLAVGPCRRRAREKKEQTRGNAKQTLHLRVKLCIMTKAFQEQPQ